MKQELTEAQLRAYLKKIEDDTKAAEEKKIFDELQATYDRCKDATFIRNDDEFPFYITYRKISNLRRESKFDNKFPSADVHETIIITLRKEDDIFGQKGVMVDSDVSIKTFETKDRSEGFLQNDYPVTETEYNKAKEYVLSRIQAAEVFFNDFTSLPNVISLK